MTKEGQPEGTPLTDKLSGMATARYKGGDGLMRTSYEVCDASHARSRGRG